MHAPLPAVRRSFWPNATLQATHRCLRIQRGKTRAVAQTPGPPRRTSRVPSRRRNRTDRRLGLRSRPGRCALQRNRNVGPQPRDSPSPAPGRPHAPSRAPACNSRLPHCALCVPAAASSTPPVHWNRKRTSRSSLPCWPQRQTPAWFRSNARIGQLLDGGILTSAGAERLRGSLTGEGFLRLLPGTFHTDGFFIAQIERTASNANCPVNSTHSLASRNSA